MLNTSVESNQLKMMKFVLLISALTVGLAVAAENRIACSPKLCDSICHNPPTKEECQRKGMEYRPNSSLCGCCATCVDYIPLLGECDVKPNLQISGGFPQIRKHCSPGSQCFDHKCLIIMN